MNKNNIVLIVAGIIVLIIAAAAFGLYYNGMHGTTTTSTGTLSMQVKDSPIQAVSHIYLTMSNITLQGSSNSTTTFKTGSITFDLLSLVNVTKSLGNVSIPTGNYTMIRFSIESAVATIAGANVTLNVPSNEIKVPIIFQVSSGKTTSIVLDITADQTLISTSNNLRPVVTGEVSGPS